MSNPAAYDVVGIGNAIVDVLTQTDDGFLAREKLTKGAMTLIDEHQAESLYVRMGERVEESGGSVANTMAGLASLGGRAAYIGKVMDDALGRSFRQAMQANGVTFRTPSAGPSSAGGVRKVTPLACIAWRKLRPSESSKTLPI